MTEPSGGSARQAGQQWGPYPPPPPLPSQQQPWPGQGPSTTSPLPESSPHRGTPPWQGPGASPSRVPGSVPWPGADGVPGVPRRSEPALRDSSRVVDLLMATALALFVALPSFVLGATTASGAVGTFGGMVASVVMPAALYWRRSRPVESAVVVYAAALIHFVSGSPLIVADVLIFVALYSVTVYGPVWAGRVALVSAMFGSLLLAVWISGSSGPGLASGGPVDFRISFDNLIPITFIGGLISVLCLFVWAMGLLRRSRLAHTETLAERAQRLEIERDQQAQIATAAERSRIAREMHDVVAHSLSVVIAQADGGRYAAAADPDAAVRALTTISETGRAALADMRKILGVLRAPGSDDSPETTTPQPIDADLDTLVDQVRSSGLDVSLVRVGTARTLPPGLGLTVYRICQEALTNVLKHGGPSASATVLIQWAPQRIVVQVDDTGRGAAATSDGAGHGLLGMQERVRLFAGTLEAAAKPGGGFHVRAEIPLPGTHVPTGIVPSGGPAAPVTPASWPQPPENGAP
ncbi:sensor histidine kinase [Georgenia sp. H159]|uniref:sensor histidine kinase n=1 Tax=Georgenia sp. H159 TaxID=3076115 RepID=UPI002D782536|nr:sensor histidine kinase [Georgenia sp. H159]